MRRFLLLIGVFLALAPACRRSCSRLTPVWNARVPDHPRLAPEFSGHLQHPLADDPNAHDLDRHRFLLHPDLHRSGPNQPRVPVRLTSWRSGTSMAPLLRKGIPIPRGATPATGSDAHLTVWQPSRDRLWDLWGSAKQGGEWTAQTGDAFKHVSQSPGYSSTDHGRRSRIRPGPRPRRRFRSRRGR